MKMMSWSRYHALSWSAPRVRPRLRHGGMKPKRPSFKRHHSVKASAAIASEGAASEVMTGLSGGNKPSHRGRGPGAGFLAWALLSLIKIFRTRVLPGDTDI
jgi:hypothetical protein